SPLDDSDFYPFGGERPAITPSSGNTFKFTGKERDSETGLDDFGARYYSSTLGRWLSPDWSAAPAAVPYADLTDPQTLNLYAYVRNSPLSHADIDGHCCEELKQAFRDLATAAANTLDHTMEGALSIVLTPDEALAGAGDSLKTAGL